MNSILLKTSMNLKKTIFITLKQKDNNSGNNGQKKQKQLLLLLIRKDKKKFGCNTNDYDFYSFKCL